MVGTYTGYEPAPLRCQSKAKPGAPGVGTLVYNELHYRKAGDSVETRQEELARGGRAGRGHGDLPLRRLGLEVLITLLTERPAGRRISTPRPVGARVDAGLGRARNFRRTDGGRDPMKRFIAHHELARDSRFVRQDNVAATVLSTLPDDVDKVVEMFDRLDADHRGLGARHRGRAAVRGVRPGVRPGHAERAAARERSRRHDAPPAAHARHLRRRAAGARRRRPLALGFPGRAVGVQDEHGAPVLGRGAPRADLREAARALRRLRRHVPRVELPVRVRVLRRSGAARRRREPRPRGPRLRRVPRHDPLRRGDRRRDHAAGDRLRARRRAHPRALRQRVGEGVHQERSRRASRRRRRSGARSTSSSASAARAPTARTRRSGSRARTASRRASPSRSSTS